MFNPEGLREECLIEINEELNKLEGGKFTGHVEFQVNLQGGVLRNMNCRLYRSIKLGGAACQEEAVKR